MGTGTIKSRRFSRGRRSTCSATPPGGRRSSTARPAAIRPPRRCRCPSASSIRSSLNRISRWRWRALRLVGMAGTVPRTLLERAIAIAAGVSIDGTADDGIVTPGERLQIEVTVWNGGDSTVRVDSIGVAAPAGWSLERLELGAPTVAPGSLLTRRFVLTVAKDADRTQPYFLRRPRSNRGGLYDWSAAPA